MRDRSLHLRLLPALALLLALGLAPRSAQADIIILNADGPGEGFFDPTPVSPVGGNPGTTRGAQRLNVFQHAADLWHAILQSPIDIVVSATFDPLACDTASAVFGSAGPTIALHSFTGAEFTNTWYHVALANKLAGQDFADGGAQISARFSSTLDGGACLDGAKWYYGFDGNDGDDVDLLPTVLHELGHGLGFSTLVNTSTGGQLQNRTDLYARFLLDNTSGLHWNQMTNGQRAASAVNVRNVAWDGSETTAQAPFFLGPRPLVRVDAPAGIAGSKTFGTASFGAYLTDPGVTGSVVLANDGTGTTSDACEALINGAQIAGNIALIDRGACPFVDKAAAAQAAGAIAVVVVNNVAGAPPEMGGSDPSITIPVVSITLADGNAIKANLPGVTMTLGADPGFLAGADNAGRVLVYTPNPLEPGSSVSHWDVTAAPDLLMEPFDSETLGQGVDLTRFHFADLGWDPVVTAAPIASLVGPVALRAAPNPFEASTAIRFALATNAEVTLSIYDLAGRLVRRLTHGPRTAGEQAVTWDGADDQGSRVAPGVYLARVAGEGVQGVHRLVRLE